MAIDLDKLAKICARFGSDFPEERATAAAIADRIVREAGITWEVFFESFDRAAQRIAELEAEHPGQSDRWQPVGWIEPETIEEAIDICLEYASKFSEWEQEFLISISGRARLSPKQMNVLNRLVDKARAAFKAGKA